MKFRRRSNLLVEPPATATGDIAFNLIVFFLVCVAITPDTGRKQEVPSSEQEKEKSQPMEVLVTREAKHVILDGNIVAIDDFPRALTAALQSKAGSSAEVADLPEKQRIVVISTKDNKDAPYAKWIKVAAMIEDVGAILTLQIEEERTVDTD
ncbi:MAG: biopolymer transporter ExbD [Phycisphaeraceae bacterium]